MLYWWRVLGFMFSSLLERVGLVLRIFASGAIAGLLAYKSKSMWPAAFFHAAHNNFDQAVFGSITVSDKKLNFVLNCSLLS